MKSRGEPELRRFAKTGSTSDTKSSTLLRFVMPRADELTSSGGAHPSRAISYDNTKAGLHVVDKDKTESIIDTISAGSSFYANEQRKKMRQQQQLRKYLEKSKVYHTAVRSNAQLQRVVRNRVAQMESALQKNSRYDRIYVHVDMDMFYAAVEEKKNPSLRDVPFGVGSYNMLSTTNYIARQYGVRSGMPGFIGRKLCPDLLIVPTDFAAYRREAGVVHSIAARYDPHFVSHGLDELTMELTSHVARCVREERGDGVVDAYDVAGRVVEECRSRIAAETGLTASAGLAPTPTLAKIASNMKKPNGQHTLRLRNAEDVERFHSTLPVRRVPGIGQYMEFILTGLGIETVGQMYEERHRLSHIFTAKTFRFLLATALGVCGGGMYDDSSATCCAVTAEEADTPVANALCARPSRDSSSEASGRQGSRSGSRSRGGAPDENAGSSRDRREDRRARASVCESRRHTDDDSSHCLRVAVERASDSCGGDPARDETAEVCENGERDAGEHTDDGDSETEDSEDELTWRKSIGQERTFSQLTNSAALSSVALRCLCMSHERLTRRNFVCSRVVLKVKHRNFRVHQYSKRLLEPTDDLVVLRNIVEELLLPLLVHYATYRLLGVRLEQLSSACKTEETAVWGRESEGDDVLRSVQPVVGVKRATMSHGTLDEMFDKAIVKRLRNRSSHRKPSAIRHSKPVGAIVIDLAESVDEEDTRRVSESHVAVREGGCEEDVVSISQGESHTDSPIDICTQPPDVCDSDNDDVAVYEV